MAHTYITYVCAHISQPCINHVHAYAGSICQDLHQCSGTCAHHICIHFVCRCAYTRIHTCGHGYEDILTRWYMHTQEISDRISINVLGLGEFATTDDVCKSHTYIHTCIHTCMCIRTYTQNVLACACNQIIIDKRTHIHAHIIHPYIHTYIIILELGSLQLLL